jgi:hypothetical protein
MFKLTASSGVDRDLFNGHLLVQEGTLAKKVQGLLAIVGDGDLDLRVTRSNELDTQGSITLVNIHGGSGGVSGQSGDGELANDLHIE